MDADEFARFEGDRIAEMRADIIYIARHAGTMSGPALAQAIRQLKDRLEKGFKLIEEKRS